MSTCAVAETNHHEWSASRQLCNGAVVSACRSACELSSLSTAASTMLQQSRFHTQDAVCPRLLPSSTWCLCANLTMLRHTCELGCLAGCRIPGVAGGRRALGQAVCGVLRAQGPVRHL